MNGSKLNVPIVLKNGEKVEAHFDINSSKFEAIYDEKIYSSTSVAGLKKLLNTNKSIFKKVDCFEFTIETTSKGRVIQNERKLENIFEDIRYKNYYIIDKLNKKKHFYPSRVLKTKFLSNISYINISGRYTTLLKIITDDIVFTRHFLNASLECSDDIDNAYKKFKNYIQNVKNSNDE